MNVIRSIGLFAAAGLAEIGGGYLVWRPNGSPVANDVNNVAECVAAALAAAAAASAAAAVSVRVSAACAPVLSSTVVIATPSCRFLRARPCRTRSSVCTLDRPLTVRV